MGGELERLASGHVQPKRFHPPTPRGAALTAIGVVVVVVGLIGVAADQDEPEGRSARTQPTPAVHPLAGAALPAAKVADGAVPHDGTAPEAAALPAGAPEPCQALLAAQHPERTGWFGSPPTSTSAAGDGTGTWVARHAVEASQGLALGTVRAAIEGCRSAPVAGLAVGLRDVPAGVAVALDRTTGAGTVRVEVAVWEDRGTTSAVAITSALDGDGAAPAGAPSLAAVVAAARARLAEVLAR